VGEALDRLKLKQAKLEQLQRAVISRRNYLLAVLNLRELHQATNGDRWDARLLETAVGATIEHMHRMTGSVQPVSDGSDEVPF